MTWSAPLALKRAEEWLAEQAMHALLRGGAAE
jgi:hypothetical protein